MKHDLSRGMRAGPIVLLLALSVAAGCETGPTRAAPSSAVPDATQTPAPTHASLAPDINPLSGMRAADASLLKVPALLVSISNFPATARPQAGLSFAPFVYEFYITEGATRFLAVFYGEEPGPEIPIHGGCATRSGPFVQSGIMLGNRVWLDANRNGMQDPGEGGVSGMCVNLYDASGKLLQRAATDSNGYYGFNVKPGQYSVEFARILGYDFTQPSAGEEAADSDADPASGRAKVNISADDLSVDAGLVPSTTATAPTGAPLPLAQVGPVRSGRLIYRYIAGSFQNSCLIYAFCLTGGAEAPAPMPHGLPPAGRRRLHDGLKRDAGRGAGEPQSEGLGLQLCGKCLFGDTAYRRPASLAAEAVFCLSKPVRLGL